MGSAFEAGQQRWRERMGTLRQVVRQELVTRQIAEHVPDLPVRRALDVGCGQGTQVLALARRGHTVTGLDSSATLLADLVTALDGEPADVRGRVHLVRGDAPAAVRAFGPAAFDVVLCHGVLMYLDDPAPMLSALSAAVAPGGLVSVLARNGDGSAMRPGLAGDWVAALAAFDGLSYVNQLGVPARADRLAGLRTALAAAGLSEVAYYGVRVFTDGAANDAPLPDPEQLDLLLACEQAAGRTDPYRAVAALTHLVARRPTAR